MKRIYFLFTLLFVVSCSLVAQAQQSKVTKTLVPLLNTIPVVYQDNVQGGYHQVADLAARDAIPASLKANGMTVWVVSSHNYFQWDGTEWRPIQFVRKWAEGSEFYSGQLFQYNNSLVTAKTDGTIGVSDNPITDQTNWNADGGFANLLVGNPTIDKITVDGNDMAVEGDAEFEGSVWFQGATNFPSDERLKMNIATLTGVLAKIEQLRGVSYEFIDQQKQVSGPQIGVIAQELQKVFPELVTRGADGFLAVNYTMLTAVLIQAVKEQQTQIDTLKLQMDAVWKKLKLDKKK